MGFTDTFSNEVSARMIAAGWVIDRYHRYEPTEMAGLTPTGKAFDITISPSGEVTVNVAGRQRTGQITLAQLHDGGDTVTALLAAYERLPANQR